MSLMRKLQHLPGFGALHGNRPGADVARQLLLHLAVDRGERWRNGQRRGRHLARHARYGRDRDGVAAVHGQQRLQRRIEETPMHRLRRGIEPMVRHSVSSVPVRYHF